MAMVVMAACGRTHDRTNDPSSDSSTTAAQSDGAAPQAAPAATLAELPDTLMTLTTDDLDRYRRGMEAQVTYVRTKAQELANAKTAMDTLNAGFALSDATALRKAGAAGSELDETHWIALTHAVDAVLGRRMTAGIASQIGAQTDTASLSPEIKARVRENLASMQGTAAYAGLPPENVKLVLARAHELDSLRLLPSALALKAMEKAR
jgi:hypothetical protein